MQVSNNNNQTYTNYNQYKDEIAKKLTEYAKNGDTEAIKQMVDEVVLSKVDSSSFDKYVEEMEGGKSSVADKFFNSLTKFLDDFVNGVNNANNTSNKEETKEPELFDVRNTNWSMLQQGVAAEIQRTKGEEYNPYSKSIGSTNPIFSLVNVDENGKITLAKDSKETLKAFLHSTVVDQKNSMERAEVGNKIIGFNGTVPTSYTQSDILKLFGIDMKGKIDYTTDGFPKWNNLINNLEKYINDDDKLDELLNNFMSSIGSKDGNSTTLESLCNNLANTEIKYVGSILGSSDNPFYFNQTLDNEHIQDTFKNGRGTGWSRDEEIHYALYDWYYSYQQFLEENNVSSNNSSAAKNAATASNTTVQNNTAQYNFVSSASSSNNFFATTSSVVSNSSAQEYVPSSTRTNSANATTSTYVPSSIFTVNTNNEETISSNIFTKVASNVKSDDLDGILDAMERKGMSETYTNANKVGDVAGVDFTKTEFKKALEERKA